MNKFTKTLIAASILSAFGVANAEFFVSPTVSASKKKLTAMVTT